MELLELYEEENRDILYSISWLNKNSIFDKSIGSFQSIDLFTFLENVNQFDYKKDTFYDDVYYILEYTQDTILYLIKNINKEIKREHRVMQISQAKEFDRTSILWLSRKNGRTLKEKLSSGKIKAVQRYSNIDTYENRIFKILLKKLVLVYEERDDLKEFEHLFIKIRKWLKSDEAKSIDEYKKIVYNNILLHHKHYSKIFKSYKWFNSLNEKVKVYADIFPEQIRTIIKFEILSQLQFKSKKYILPRTLQVDYNDFELKVQDYILNLKLDEIVSKITTNVLEKKLPFQFINKFSEQLIIKQLKIKLDQNRIFGLNTQQVKEVYLDLFRLFPICKINNKTITLPITIKQMIEDKVVNANNTKIIDLNHEVYTLPEILKTFDTNVLKYFLDDFTDYFKDNTLNYIVPDYVNIFEFSQVKRLVSGYFKNSKSIPKSILAGFSYIERNEVKVDDTLLYLQKNYDDELFVTPLLIKSNPKLKKITNGLYIERHPTRKIEDSNQELVASLSKIFSKKIAEELISKFLRNGIKGIKNEKIVFYQDEKIIDLNRLQLPNSKYTNILNLRKTYSGKKTLFKTEHKFISDETNENLDNFEKISNYEKQGFMLWREHLPDLSMEIVKNGCFDKFVLVDENSRIENKIIEIKEKFLIPAEVKELSFPLYLDNQNIGFKAEVTSKQLPFKNDVTCTLELTYDYERETPYELTFKPLGKELKDIKVKWIKEDYSNMELPVPSYPPKKSWDDLQQFLNKYGKKIDLLEWISQDFNKIIKIYHFYTNHELNKRVYIENMYFDWWKDRKGNYASIVNIPNIGEVFFHQNQFDDFKYDDIAILSEFSFELEKSDRGGFRAIYVSKGKSISKKELKSLIKSIRFPLYTIWKDGNSLLNAPSEFRDLAYKAITYSLKLIANSNIPKQLRDELFLFLSIINGDTDEKIIKTLLGFINNEKKFKEYYKHIAYSVGCSELDWQKEFLSKMIKLLKSTNEKVYSNSLKAIGISIWRCPNIIDILLYDEINLILNTLYKSLEIKIKRNELTSYRGNFIKESIAIRLELLLGILRARKNKEINELLSPQNSLIKKYIILIDSLSQKITNKKIHFKSRVELKLDKSDLFKETPDLLYALRVYLSGDNGAANSIQVLGISDD